MSISVQHLTKRYGAQTAVNDISFTANSGEILGFLGPNGAGKSTTMKIITGYLAADAGDIAVCGEAVSSGTKNTKKHIGYLPESNPLYTDMYIKEYLHFVAGVHGIKNKKEAVEKVIAKTGLKPEAGKKIGQLSKGYRQRVGLAAAIIHDPEVLILDEPTTGLDPNQILEIRQVIRELGKNKTVLLSSHIMQEVEALCDRVIIINKGNIVANDSMKDLKQQKAGQEFVVVVFNETVNTSDLEKLPGAAGVSVQGKEYKIITKNADQFRRALLEYSVQKNINIVSMQQASNSMEEIFRKLTGEENKPNSEPQKP